MWCILSVVLNFLYGVVGLLLCWNPLAVFGRVVVDWVSGENEIGSLLVESPRDEAWRCNATVLRRDDTAYNIDSSYLFVLWELARYLAGRFKVPSDLFIVDLKEGVVEKESEKVLTISYYPFIISIPYYTTTILSSYINRLCVDLSSNDKSLLPPKWS